jgi:hypothetical protein
VSARQAASSAALIAVVGAVTALLALAFVGSNRDEALSPDAGIYEPPSPPPPSLPAKYGGDDGGISGTEDEEEQAGATLTEPAFTGKWFFGFGYNHMQLARHHSEYGSLSAGVRNEEFALSVDLLIGGKQILLPPSPSAMPTSGDTQFSLAADLNLSYTLYSSTLTRPFLSLREGIEAIPDLALRSTAAFGLAIMIPSVGDTELFVGYTNTTNFSQAAHGFMLGGRIMFPAPPRPSGEHDQARVVLGRRLDDMIRNYGKGFQRLKNGSLLEFIDHDDFTSQRFTVAWPNCYVAIAVGDDHLTYVSPVDFTLEIRADDETLLDVDQGGGGRDGFPLFDDYCPAQPSDAQSPSESIRVVLKNNQRFGAWGAVALLRRNFVGKSTRDDDPRARFLSFEKEQVNALAAAHAPVTQLQAPDPTDEKIGAVFHRKVVVPSGHCYSMIAAAPPDADLDALTFVRRTSGDKGWWELVDSDTKPFPDARTQLCNVSSGAHDDLTVDTLYSIMPDPSQKADAVHTVPVTWVVFDRPASAMRGPQATIASPPPPPDIKTNPADTWVISPSFGDFRNGSFAVPMFVQSEQDLEIGGYFPPAYGDPPELLKVIYRGANDATQTIAKMHGTVLHATLEPRAYYYLYMPMATYRPRAPFVLRMDANKVFDVDPLKSK